MDIKKEMKDLKKFKDLFRELTIEKLWQVSIVKSCSLTDNGVMYLGKSINF